MRNEEQELRGYILEAAGTGKPYEEVIREVSKIYDGSSGSISSKVEEMIEEGDLLTHQFYIADASDKAFWESSHNWRVWARRAGKTVEFVLDWV